MKRILKTVSLMLAFVTPSAALAAGGNVHLKDVEFSFDGPFGTFDQAEVQRGFQVYKEVCASCHGMKFVSFHELEHPDGPAFSVEQVKAIAAEFYVPDDSPEALAGDERPGRRSDHFPAGTDIKIPDLSTMARARANGPAHIYSILTSYTGKSEAGLYENTAFPGGWISMAPPLREGQVEYQDGTEATSERMAHDVSAFLSFIAEPHQIQRKRAGFRTIGYLIVFAVMLYFVNRRLWKKVKHPEA